MKKKLKYIRVNQGVVVVPKVGAFEMYEGDEEPSFSPIRAAVTWSSIVRVLGAVMELQNLKKNKTLNKFIKAGGFDSFYGITVNQAGVRSGGRRDIYIHVFSDVRCGCQSISWDDVVSLAKKLKIK